MRHLLALLLFLVSSLGAAQTVSVNANGSQSQDQPYTLAVTGTAGQALLSLYGVLDGVTGATTFTPSGVWPTWEEVGRVDRGGGVHLVLFQGRGTPSDGTISVAISGGGFVEGFFGTLWLDQVTGANTTDPTVQVANASGTGTTAAVTLSAFASGSNGAYAVAVTNNGQTWTQGTDWSLLQQDADALNIGHAMMSEWRADADTSADATMTGGGDDWTMIAVEIAEAGGAATHEQEGFRWGVDDGNEAAHTWEAAQDTNISIADTQSRLLRALVNATGDTASTAYTLRYQKNGSGGYVAVPVGSTTSFSISNQTVAASADDAQQIGTTMTLNGTTIGGSLDATTDWAGMRFTAITIPPGATITSATLEVVPSATTEDEPLVTVYLEAADDCATFTTTASDISNRSRTTGVSWSSTDLAASGSSYHAAPSLVSDVQAVINRGGWASGNDLCVIIQGGATGTRDLTIEAYDLGPGTNPPRLSVGWTTPNEVYVTTSANITAGGEATTARLTAPAGKTTSDFVTGRRWDDENGSDSIDITTDDYTEVEWLTALSSAPAAADYFDFRVYAGASPLDTYSVTPRWTIPGGGSAVPKAAHHQLFRMQ